MYSYTFTNNDRLEDMIFFNEKENADEYAATHMSAHASVSKAEVKRIIKVNGCFTWENADTRLVVWVQEVKPLDAVDDSSDVWVA